MRMRMRGAAEKSARAGWWGAGDANWRDEGHARATCELTSLIETR